MKKKIFILFCFLRIHFMNAQELVPITLEKALELAGANNNTLKMLDLNQQVATLKNNKAKDWLFPELYGGVKTHQLDGTAMNSDGRYAVDISRDNLWLGMGARINWDLAKGIYGMKIAAAQNKAMEFRTTTERNAILSEVISTYYDCLTAQLKYFTYNDLVKKADTIALQLQLQVEAGIRYQSEFLLAQSNLNHAQIELFRAKAVQEIKLNKLTMLLNIPEDKRLVLVDAPLVPIDIINPLDKINYEIIYENRSEINELNLELKTLEYQKKQKTIGLLLPSLVADFNYAYSGVLRGDLVPTNNPINIKNSYPTTQFNVGLFWNIPLSAILNGNEKKILNTKIVLQNEATYAFKLMINEALKNAQTQLSAIKEQLKFAKLGNQFAQEALSQSIQRQNLGTVIPFEVFQAQEIFIQSRLDYLAVITAYNKAQYALYIAMGNNL